jgi:hypothetical protein
MATSSDEFSVKVKIRVSLPFLAPIHPRPLIARTAISPLEVKACAVRGENGTDYFRPTDRPKAYGTQKRIRSDSWQIRSRIRLVLNRYGKGYGFTNIRSYP